MWERIRSKAQADTSSMETEWNKKRRQTLRRYEVVRLKAKGIPCSMQVTRSPVEVTELWWEGVGVQKAESLDNLLYECKQYQKCISAKMHQKCNKKKPYVKKVIFLSNNRLP